MAVVAVGLTALAMASTGAASPKSSQATHATKKITIEVWDVQYFPKEAGAAGAFGRADQQIDAAFEKKYPNIAVNHVGVPGSDFITDMREFVASRSGPDITTDGGETYPVSSGFYKAMYPMYKLINSNPTFKAQLGGYLTEESQGDAAHYAIPNLGNVNAMYYNKGDFAAAGIKTVPQTLAQLLTDCTALTKVGITPITNGWSGPSGTAIWNYGIMSQLLSPSQLVAWANLKLGWNAPQFAAGLSDLGQMVSAGCFGNPAEAATETDVDGESAFIGNRGAMMYWSTLPSSTFSDYKNVGVFAMPKMPTSAYPVGTPAGGYNANWSLMSYSKHCLAAWDWIEFYDSPQAQQILWKVSGTLPVNNAVKTNAPNAYEQDLIELATNKNLHSGIGGTMSASEATLQQALMPTVIDGQLSDSQFISQMTTERATVTPPSNGPLPNPGPCTMNS